MRRICVAIFGMFFAMALAWAEEPSAPPVQDAALSQAFAWFDSGQYEQALPVLLQYQESDAPEVLCRLGDAFWAGNGVEQDLQKAFAFLSRAAELGDTYALERVGTCYMDGTGVEQDLAKAEEYLTKAVAGGDKWAELSLGLLFYDYGDGSPETSSKALEHLRNAYDAGIRSRNCAGRIGQLLFVTSENPQEAIPFLEEAADDQDDIAINALIIEYAAGMRFPRDASRALRYARLQGERFGDWSNYCQLHRLAGLELLLQGQTDDAMLHLEYASALGDERASYWVAKRHPVGLVRDKVAADLAAAGYHDFFCQAGTYLATEKKDYEASRKYYLEAAEDGDTQAMCELGIMYRLGEGVEADYDTAMSWYAKAAEELDARALREIGIMYFRRHQANVQPTAAEDASPDLVFAYLYTVQAVAAGDQQANDYLQAPEFAPLAEVAEPDSDLERAWGLRDYYLGGDAESQCKGLQLLERSASRGNMGAMCDLGPIYGYETAASQSDLKKAAGYLLQAVEKGNIRAEKLLCNPIWEQVLGKDAHREILRRQSEQGNHNATYWLADIYYHEDGNLEEGLKLYLEAARQGSSAALWVLFTMKQEDRPADWDKELKELMSQAVDQRHDAFLESAIGVYIMNPLETMKDLLLSREFLLDAVLNGSRLADAYTELAYMSILGEATQRAPSFAATVLEMGIRQDLWECCTMLGDLYAHAVPEVVNLEGFPQDLDYARKVYELGAQHNVLACREALEKLAAEESSKPAE